MTDKRVPPCRFCDGSGKHYTQAQIVDYGDVYLEERCVFCNGTGAAPAVPDEPVPLSEWQQLVAERDALKAALRELAALKRSDARGRIPNHWTLNVPKSLASRIDALLAAPEDAPK